MEYEAFSLKDTKKIANEFSKMLDKGDVICLYGDLGAGKTAFTIAVCEALNTKSTVSSPTFTIVNEYRADIPIFHFDTYRISDADEMYEIGFDEYIYSDGVCIIEWADKIIEILPSTRYDITIKKDYLKGDNYRKIVIENNLNQGRN